MKIKIYYLKNDIVWLLLVLFSWFPALAYSIGNLMGVSLGIYGTVILLVFFFVIILCKKSTVSKKTILFGCFIIGTILFAIIKWPYMLEGDMRDYIYLAMIMIMFGLSFNKCLTNKQIHLLYVIPCYITYIMSFIALFPTSYDLGNYKNALYLHFQNPNILSFVLLNIMIFQLLGYIDEKKKCYLVSVILVGIMIILTHSRSSLMAALFLLLFYFLRNKWKKVGTIMAVGASLIPLVVVCFSTMVNGMKSFQIFGKSGLSGREDIWQYIIDSLKSNIEFVLFGKGIYMDDYLNTAYNNSHNAYLQFICNFGIPMFVVILVCITFLNIKAGKNIIDKYTFVCYFASCSILVNCSLETHIADSIIGLTFMWIMLYWINISKGKGQDYDNNGETIGCARITEQKVM